MKGLGGGDCYELIDTVVGSSILPLRPVIEYSSTENFNEAFKLVDRLPASAHHGGLPFPPAFPFTTKKILTKFSSLKANEFSPSASQSGVVIELLLSCQISATLTYVEN